MLRQNFLELLNLVAKGKLSPDGALEQLGYLPFQSMVNGLNLDLHRALRTGFAEVVFAEGKSDEHLVSAVESLAAARAAHCTCHASDANSAKGSLPAPLSGNVLVTRLSRAQATLLGEHFPKGNYYPVAGLFTLGAPLALKPPWTGEGDVVVVSAGAADMPVALEAFGTALFFGLKTGFISDIGVAGVHRLAPHLPFLARSKVVIAVAGMEGALPGVLAGLLPCPVVAVPTSVGYGVSSGGFAALIGMLASCVPGLSVVNIDNGFGAAAFAAKMLQQEINNV